MTQLCQGADREPDCGRPGGRLLLLDERESSHVDLDYPHEVYERDEGVPRVAREHLGCGRTRGCGCGSATRRRSCPAERAPPPPSWRGG